MPYGDFFRYNTLQYIFPGIILLSWYNPATVIGLSPGYRKGCSMYSRKDESDWEVTTDGLYIASRGFLIRRGYCCANKCRNCPYINWRNHPDWQPIPAEYVKRTRVSLKSIAGAQALLAYHEKQILCSKMKEQEKHREMIIHYQMLLERWDNKK